MEFLDAQVQRRTQEVHSVRKFRNSPNKNYLNSSKETSNLSSFV